MRSERSWRTAGIALLLPVLLVPGSAGATRSELACPALVHSPPASVAVPYGEGLLWRIESPGDQQGPPTYLFGTIHVSDPRVVSLPAPVQAALDASAEFIMEATFDPPSVSAFAAAMTLPDGQRLEDIIGPALYARSRELLAGFSVPGDAVQRLRPWAAFMTLNQPRGDDGLPLDLVLMQRASAAGKPVHGIETLHEQAQVFAAFSEADQVVMLRDTVCNFDRIQADVGRLRSHYLRRDLGAIVRMTEEYDGSDPQLSERMLKALIDDRNARMAERLRPWLRQGGAFIAVGALHLPGEQGLLALLRNQGMRLTRVY